MDRFTGIAYKKVIVVKWLVKLLNIPLKQEGMAGGIYCATVYAMCMESADAQLATSFLVENLLFEPLLKAKYVNAAVCMVASGIFFMHVPHCLFHHMKLPGGGGLYFAVPTCHSVTFSQQLSFIRRAK